MQRQRIREGYRRNLGAFEHAIGQSQGDHPVFQGPCHLRREPARRDCSSDVGTESGEQATGPIAARRQHCALLG